MVGTLLSKISYFSYGAEDSSSTTTTSLPSDGTYPTLRPFVSPLDKATYLHSLATFYRINTYVTWTNVLPYWLVIENQIRSLSYKVIITILYILYVGILSKYIHKIKTSIHTLFF